MKKQDLHRLKISMCRSCGIWCQCQVGFSRWLDQKECRFAVKSERRDQCRYTSEAGHCNSHDARNAAQAKEAD